MRLHRLDDQFLEQQSEHDHGNDKTEQESKPKRQAEKVDGEQHEEGRQHHELALGKVHRLGCLPEERKADRGERINGPSCQPGKQHLQELRQGKSPVR